VALDIKLKVRLVQEVKHYGEETLGLKKTKSYSEFLEVKGPILHVVTACEKDKLQLHSWNFPIVGNVTYRGFFTQEDALNEKRSLEGKGYDSFLQKASAYSTLGWFRDPIFSSMLGSSDAALTNLILHEMTHATIYVKGHTDFNEQVATFVGNQGAVDFLSEWYGPGSSEVEEALAYQSDDLLFSQWIDQACRRLSGFYAREIPREEKLKGREDIFRSIQEQFKETEVQFKTGTYAGFEKVELNNAVLLAHRQYLHRLEKFETLYQNLGGNLSKVIGYLKNIKTTQEAPSTFLDRWGDEQTVGLSPSLQ
jgi:predicted aminopeptidase